MRLPIKLQSLDFHCACRLVCIVQQFRLRLADAAELIVVKSDVSCSSLGMLRDVI